MNNKLLISLLVIAIGAVLGAWLRWIFSNLLNHLYPNLPLGTLLVNVIGCFIIGLAVGFFDRPSVWLAHEYWRLIIITGFCGSLTTFSSFSAELINLLYHGNFTWAIFVFLAHNFLGLLATFIGFFLSRL